MNAPVLPKTVTYDVEAVRLDFPALSMEVNGKPLCYLDNGASAQKPRQVLDAIRHSYEAEYANVHRGLHYLANAATEAFEDAREQVRGFLNAGSLDEIVFTRSATGSLNLVASSFGRMAGIGPGDEIVISLLEHHSNIVPWHFHRERSGAVLKWVPVSEEGEFDLAAYERLLTPKTKIVAITHMSNVTGTITPVKEIIRLAHERGIPVLLDGSQAAVHMPVDVRDLDVDFYVFTGHKLYGPTGIGVLYAKREWLERMPPYEGGGEMIRDVSEDGVTYAGVPSRFEAGTPPLVQAVGLGAAIRYVNGIGREAILAHETVLRDYAMERLSRINALRIFGTTPDKGAIVAFEMKDAHAHDVAHVLDRYGIAVRAGTHCAQPLLARYGVTSTCRASFGLYNTTAEIDTLVEALEKTQALFA
ncbi:cysteine desulfurase [Terrihabitans rhizophilus]|uniref:Cysteine desulfurase n=1 Tax=Terrihabitans rhizophilus TaxID=3092662 RepID=A0ABU4RNX2_9HYPH|nr:cysteine desulfurase [Terrihabitans sp. PJ23]MDX6805405.1 cysteine desulfurase [Terrihabitans sp. PJ23]